MKILIVRFSSIGDIVLTTPLLRCIKEQRPDITVHYLTKDAFRPVLAGNKYIDKLHFLEEDLDAVIKDLKKENFDYIIDLHRNLRSARVKRALKCKSYTFSKLNIRKWMLVNFKMKSIMPDKSIVLRYFDAVKGLGIKTDGKGLDYFIPEYINLKNQDIPMSHWGGYVGCVIGGSYSTKKLPVNKWIEFCTQVPYPVILLGGPEDAAEGKEIAALDPVKIYNSCGKFNLNESAWLIKLSRIVVTNDTGLMHIAAAFNKTIISLWGNTSPEMGMFPYYGNNNIKTFPAPQSIIMENNDLNCHPCSKLGYSKCPKGHFKCMNSLDTKQMAEYVKKNW